METNYHYSIVNDGKTILFTELPQNKDFIKGLVRAFAVIDFELIDTADFWENDEIAVKATSDSGEFTIKRNMEGYYYIESDYEEDINTLDVILSGSDGFEKIL